MASVCTVADGARVDPYLERAAAGVCYVTGVEGETQALIAVLEERLVDLEFDVPAG